MINYVIETKHHKVCLNNSCVHQLKQELRKLRKKRHVVNSLYVQTTPDKEKGYA